MKIEPYIKKLSVAKEYKDFMGKNPDSYVVAGFFILDFESNNNLHQIDYYIPKAEEGCSFYFRAKNHNADDGVA